MIQRRGHTFIRILIIVFSLCGFSDISLVDIETAILENDYQKAQSLANTLVARGASEPEKQYALYYSALSHLKLGHYVEAQEVFRGLVKDPASEEIRDKAYLGLMDALFLQGEYSAAARKSEKLLRRSRNSEFLSLIYLKYARINLKLSRWQKATTYLNKILDQFPGSPEAPVARQFLEEKQYFAVQVGAFMERKRSLQLVSELKAKGEYAYMVETLDPQGQTFYRVRVGKLTLLKEAEHLKSRLAKLGYPTAIYP